MTSAVDGVYHRAWKGVCGTQNDGKETRIEAGTDASSNPEKPTVRRGWLSQWGGEAGLCLGT